MMEFLHNLLDNSQIAVVTAFLLGLLTAVSPCPLATNITAIGFISKGISQQKRVLWNGLLYTLGRALAYSVLGAVLIFILRKGADVFDLQMGISQWGEKILGPALVAIGLLMLLSEFISLGGKFGFQGNSWSERLSGPLGSFVLGVLFALAFCPTSGLLYFGMLIPMSVTATAGYLLPVVYALATAFPVLVMAFILAYSVQSLGRFMGRMAAFQKWFNRLVAILFVAVGIYYIHMIFF